MKYPIGVLQSNGYLQNGLGDPKAHLNKSHRWKILFKTDKTLDAYHVGIDRSNAFEPKSVVK